MRIGWYAWTHEDGAIVRRDSRSTSWADVPTDGFLALIEIHDRLGARGQCCRTTYYGQDYYWQTGDGEFHSGSKAAPGAKVGYEIDAEDWEAFRLSIVNAADEKPGDWL